jgi:ATP-dependent DNA ligase
MAFTRIRDAVAALSVESAVLDGDVILLRPDNTSGFEGLRARQGQQRRSWWDN